MLSIKISSKGRMYHGFWTKNGQETNFQLQIDVDNPHIGKSKKRHCLVWCWLWKGVNPKNSNLYLGIKPHLHDFWFSYIPKKTNQKSRRTILQKSFLGGHIYVWIYLKYCKKMVAEDKLTGWDWLEDWPNLSFAGLK